jgi:hypothetical protein|tara:strand:- start:930 stop:1148 length:219 start_codon:yes stop_codon:yes gene_type:complete
MLTHDHATGEIRIAETDELVCNTVYRDGAFDFVPTGDLAAISDCTPHTFFNFKAGEYWVLAMVIEYLPDARK